jgi:hypothetical protein
MLKCKKNLTINFLYEFQKLNDFITHLKWIKSFINELSVSGKQKNEDIIDDIKKNRSENLLCILNFIRRMKKCKSRKMDQLKWKQRVRRHRK